jgi:chromosome partitioning protein
MTKIVSIANQKGGVGKSTLTSVVANYIHYEKRGRVKTIVVDADTQKTLSRLRELDIKENGLAVDKLYKLVSMDANSLVQNIDMFSTYDIVFVDLPGTIMQSGVIEAYSLIDVLFIPTGLSRADLDSTMDFYRIILNEIVPLREKYGLVTGDIWGILNKIKQNTIEYKEFEQSREDMPFRFIDNSLPDSHVAFQREASTFMPYNEEKTLKFCKEVYSKITGESSYGKTKKKNKH